MSAASELRALGLDVLSDPTSGSGETLQFRGASVESLVNYKAPPPMMPDVKQGKRRDTDRGQSTVEIRRSLLNDAPRVGESFTGEDGRRHRIKELPQTTDLTYICECELSNPITEGGSS